MKYTIVIPLHDIEFSDEEETLEICYCIYKVNNMMYVMNRIIASLFSLFNIECFYSAAFCRYIFIHHSTSVK